MRASVQMSPPKKPTRRTSGPASRSPCIADAEPVEQGKIGRRDEFAAHLAAREFGPFDDGDGPALPRQRDRSGGACGPGADDDRIIDHRHSAGGRAKTWLNSPPRRSSSGFPCPAGQSAESSLPANPPARWRPRHAASRRWRRSPTAGARQPAENFRGAVRWPAAPARSRCKPEKTAGEIGTVEVMQEEVRDYSIERLCPGPPHPSRRHRR